tara:strand:- start:97206 stop:97871 length:666 start_codon:yes stop_codon:yes gene_type:complete
MMNRSKQTTLLIAVAMTILTLIPGCNIVTPIAYAIHGPQKINPVYELNEELKTVVFVDDPSSKITQRRLRYTIAKQATSELLDKRILVDMLDPRGILTAASNERFGEQMSISELGKSVGADIVIYAVVTDFSISPEAGAYIPRASLRIKVIDVAEGQRVWPSDTKGHIANIQIPQRPGNSPESSTSGARLEVEQELAQRAGTGLAQLFYKHEITETVLNRR